jgi:hypothetical protein
VHGLIPAGKAGIVTQLENHAAGSPKPEVSSKANNAGCV